MIRNHPEGHVRRGDPGAANDREALPARLVHSRPAQLHPCRLRVPRGDGLRGARRSSCRQVRVRSDRIEWQHISRAYTTYSSKRPVK